MPTKRKLPKITNYVKNVGKSLAFASVDVIKDNTPGITEFLEANNETFKKIYAGAKNYKQSLKTMERNLKQSSVYKAIDMGIKSAIEDAKNGTFYNTTRAASVSEEAIGMDDDFDFNMSFEDDEGSSSSGKAVSNDSKFLAGSLEGAISSSAIANSTAVAQGTATVVKSNRVNTQLIMANMDKISHTITSGLGTLYNPVNDINKFMQGPLHNHLENSKLYYENSIKVQQEMQAMMKEMLDMQRALYKGNESSDRNNQTPLDAIFPGGTFDLDAYLKNVKSNIKDKLDDSGLGMLGDWGGGINPMLMIAAAPFNDAIKSIVSKAIPKAFKNALRSFDKGVSTFMSTLVSQMNYNSKNGDGFWELLGEVLGINTETKRKIDTSKYNKKAVHFDGVTRKAITEVIPGYLSRIEAAITGKQASDARHYDYENGKWKSGKEIEGEWVKMLEEQVGKANHEFLTFITKQTENLTKEIKESIRDDALTFSKQVFADGGRVITEKQNKDDEDPFMHYGISPESMNFFKGILNRNPNFIRDMAYNNMKGNQDLTRLIKDLESNGSSSFNILFDGSYNNGKKFNRGNPSGYETTTNIINAARDREGKGIFYYLKEILTTIKNRPRPKTKVENNNGRNRNREKSGSNNSSSNSSSSDDSDGEDPDPLYQEETKAKYDSLDDLLYEIDRQKAEENKKENNKKALGNWLRDKVGGTAVGKFIIKVSDKLGGILNKPLQYATNLLNKADKKLFDLMFGDKLTVTIDGEPHECSNLLEYVGLSVKKVFDNAGKWIKENLKKVFDSLKNKFQPLIDKYISPVWENMKDILGRGKDRVAEAFPNTFGKWFDIADEKRRERKARKQAEKDMENGGVSSADDVENAANGVETSAAGRFVTKRGLTMISPGEIIIPASFDPKEQAKMLALEKRDRRRILNAMGNGKISLNAKGTVSKEELNKTKETLSKIYNDNKGKASRNTAAGLLGAGAGILTGFGPVIGAVAGAGLSILTNSETFKTVMFGKAITDEEGNTVGRSGGVVSKKIYDVFKKAAPDMGDFGVAGGLLGLFTPFGPLGGAAIGAGIGFLKNSESFHKFIFGDEAAGKDGIMKKETYDKFKSMVDKAVPNMAVGAVGGALFGPFGLLGNAAMGAGLGLLSSTNTFKKFLFGEDAEWQGNETGGMVGALYRGIVMPAQKHITEIFTDLKEWGKENILKPLKNAWEPVKQMIKNVFTDLGNSLKNMFKDMVGKPIYDFLQQKIFKPVTNAIFKIIKLPLNLAKGAISLPFKAIQGLGNSLRMSQIRRGTANDMSAGQRLAFRDEHKVRAFGNNLFGRDNTIDQDKMIAGMQIDELSNLSNLLGASLTGKDKIKRDADHASISAGNSVSKILNAKQDDGGILWDLEVLKKKNGFKLKKLASEGKVKEYETLVKELDLSDETKKKFLDPKVLSAIKTAGVTSKRAELSDKDSKDLDDAIENITGRKMNSRQKGHLLSNLESEIGIREKLNDKETASEFGNTPDGLVRATKEYQEIYAQRTQDLIDTLDQSNKYLEKLTSAKGLDDLNELDYDNKKSLIEAVSKGFERALSRMKSNLSNAGHYGEGIVEDTVNGTFNAVGNAGRKIANSKAVNAVKKGASKAAEGIKNVFGDGEPDIETNAFGGMSKRRTASMVSAGESIQPRDSFLSVMKKTLVKPIAGLAASIRNKPVLDPTTGNMITNDPDSKENTENARKHKEMERRDIEQLETSKSSVGIFKAFGEKLFGGKKKKGGILSSIGSGLGGILKFLGVGSGSIAKMGLKVLGIAGGVSLLGFASQWWKKSVWPTVKGALFGGGNGSGENNSGLLGGIRRILIGDSKEPGVLTKVKQWWDSKGGLSGIFVNEIIPKMITGWGYAMDNVLAPLVAIVVKNLPKLLWGLGKGIVKGLKMALFGGGKKYSRSNDSDMVLDSSDALKDIDKLTSKRSSSLKASLGTSGNSIESAFGGSNSSYYTTTKYTLSDNYDDGYSSSSSEDNWTNAGGLSGLLGNQQRTNDIEYDSEGNILTNYSQYNTNESILGKAAHGAGRGFLKGFATGNGANIILKKGAKISGKGIGLGALKHTTGIAKKTAKGTSVVLGGAKNSGAALNKLVQAGTDKTGKIAAEMLKTTAEGTAKKGIKNSIQKNLVKAFRVIGESKIGAKILSLINKATGTKLTQKILCNTLEKIASKIGKNIVGKAGARALKAISGALGKVPFLQVAIWLIDFLSGYNNAYTILGVAKGGDYEVGIPQKIVCGLVNLITNQFTLGLIPASTIIDLVVDGLFPLMGMDGSKLYQARSEESVNSVLDEWNKLHPEDQYDNLEDFNKKDKLTTKAWKGIKNFFGLNGKNKSNSSSKTTSSTKSQTLNTLSSSGTASSAGMSSVYSTSDTGSYEVSNGSESYDYTSDNTVDVAQYNANTAINENVKNDLQNFVDHTQSMWSTKLTATIDWIDEIGNEDVFDNDSKEALKNHLRELTRSAIQDAWTASADTARYLFMQLIGGYDPKNDQHNLGKHLAASTGMMAGGAAAGALVGSVVPGIGTAIGAVVGGVVGCIGGLIESYIPNESSVYETVKNSVQTFVDKLHLMWADKLTKTTEWLDDIVDQDDLFNNETKAALVESMRENTRGAITSSWNESSTVAQGLFTTLIQDASNSIANAKNVSQASQSYQVKENKGLYGTIREAVTSLVNNVHSMWADKLNWTASWINDYIKEQEDMFNDEQKTSLIDSMRERTRQVISSCWGKSEGISEELFNSLIDSVCDDIKKAGLNDTARKASRGYAYTSKPDEEETNSLSIYNQVHDSVEKLVFNTNSMWADKLGWTADWINDYIKNEELFNDNEKNTILDNVRQTTKDNIISTWNSTLSKSEEMFTSGVNDYLENDKKLSFSKKQYKGKDAEGERTPAEKMAWSVRGLWIKAINSTVGSINDIVKSDSDNTDENSTTYISTAPILESAREAISTGLNDTFKNVNEYLKADLVNSPFGLGMQSANIDYTIDTPESNPDDPFNGLKEIIKLPGKMLKAFASSFAEAGDKIVEDTKKDWAFDSIETNFKTYFATSEEMKKASEKKFFRTKETETAKKAMFYMARAFQSPFVFVQRIFEKATDWMKNQDSVFNSYIDFADNATIKTIDKNNQNGMGKHYGFGRVSQLDPDVANMPYNGHTIGEAGCGPVAATNLINGMYQGQYGGDIVSLQDAAEYATANGYKPSNDGTDPRFMRSILNKYGIRTSGVTGRNQIEQNLMSGNPVVLMGKGNSPDSPYGNNNPHYITAVGFDDNGNVIVDDPYERELTTYPENEVMNGVIDSISAKGYGKKPMSRIRRTISRGYGKASRHTISRRRGFGKYGFGRFGFGKILGHISAKYETGGWNPGMVSSGAGDHGGISYGLSQFSTTQGSAKSFVSWLSKKYPTLGSYFEGLSPGTSAFGNAWKKCYSEHGDEFANAQTEYTYENMVQPWINKAKSKTGIDFSRSMALKEAAYSTAVQFGPSGLQMLKNVTSGMSDQEVITAMYDDKINNVSTYFRSSSSSVQAGVKSRFQREKQDLLDLIGKDGEYSYTGPGSAPSGSGTSGNSTSGTLLNQFTNLGTSMVKAMFGDDAYEALYGSQNSGDESSGSSSMAGNGSVESFVQTALNEEGYHEKASNSNLDDKTANSGSRNYTKYGQHFNLNGQPWCAQFVSWSADKAGIPATAINRTASVSSFNEFFKSKNRFHGPGSGYTPKRGDVFMRGGEHTGIVTGITDGKLKTIEGNTSDTVAQRSYNLSTCGFSYGDLGLGSGSGTSGMEGTTETTKAFGKGRIRRNAKTQYAKQMKYGYGIGSPTVTYAGTPTTYYNTNSSNQAISYEVFLQTIITILTNIADNSAVLSKILEILSSQFNINIDKTDLDKASAKTKEQTEASLRDLINRSNNNNTGISKLLNNRDTEYVIKAMKAIASE